MKPKWTMHVPRGYTGNARKVRSGEGRFLERRNERIMHFLPRQVRRQCFLRCHRYVRIIQSLSLTAPMVFHCAHFEFHGKRPCRESHLQTERFCRITRTMTNIIFIYLQINYVTDHLSQGF